MRKGFLRNLAKFTGKHLCQSLFFNKVFIKKDALVQAFSCKFCEISKNIFFTEHLRWMVLPGRLLGPRIVLTEKERTDVFEN